MSEPEYQRKLEIAKRAYKGIKAAIDQFESQGLHYCAHWDECISVDDEFFQGCELRDG